MQQHIDLGLRKRGRTGPAPQEPGDLRGLFDELKAFIVQFHFDQHVAREKLLGGQAFFSFLDFDNLLGGHQDAVYLLVHARGLGPLLDTGFDPCLKTRIGMNDVPLHMAKSLPPFRYKSRSSEDHLDQPDEQMIDHRQKDGNQHHQDQHHPRRTDRLQAGGKGNLFNLSPYFKEKIRDSSI